MQDISLDGSMTVNKLPLRGDASFVSPHGQLQNEQGQERGCSLPSLPSPHSYLQNDGGSRLLIQDSCRTEQFKGRVRVVDELGVVVNEQGLYIVEDKAKLVWPLHSIQAWAVVRGERGRQAGEGGGVYSFAHLRGPECRTQTLNG